MSITGSTAGGFARLAVDHVQQAHMVERGTPEVLVSRLVLGADLTCLGLQAPYTLHPDEPLALVILKGHFTARDLPSGTITAPHDVHYLVYIYTVRGQELTGELASFRGDGLQIVLQDPSLPEGDFGGVPAARQDPIVAAVLGSERGRSVEIVQRNGGWAITVEQVYADANRVVVRYRVQGPARRFAVDRPTLTDARGRAFPWLGRAGTGSEDVPEELVWFDSSAAGAAGPTPPLSFTLPAIRAQVHTLPAQPPCARERLPTLAPAAATSPWSPTGSPPAPTWTAATGPSLGAPPTPVPETRVGPFRFRLAVAVAPATPWPTVPPPVPTRVSLLGLPLAVPTGAARLAPAGTPVP